MTSDSRRAARGSGVRDSQLGYAGDDPEQAAVEDVANQGSSNAWAPKGSRGAEFTLLDQKGLDFLSIVSGSSQRVRGISSAPSVRDAPQRSSRDRGRSCIRSARRPTSLDRILGASRTRSLPPNPVTPRD